MKHRRFRCLVDPPPAAVMRQAILAGLLVFGTRGFCGIPPERTVPVLLDALYHEQVAGTDLSALSETESPIDGDTWYWTDDNAKALEALALPEVFSKYPVQAAAIARFIQTNAPPPFVFRRRVEDRIAVIDDNPRHLRIHTGLMNFEGDLTRGGLHQSYRFHDGRTEDAVTYAVDTLSFNRTGRRVTVNPAAITPGVEILAEERAVTLVQHWPVEDGADTVARLELRYRIEANKPYLALTLNLRAEPGQTLEKARVGTVLAGLDRLSGPGYTRFFGFRRSAAAAPMPPGQKNSFRWWSIVQDGNLGFSYAVNTLVDTPDHLLGIARETRPDGSFGRVSARYDLGRVEPGQTVAVAERKLLVAGGLYNSMAAYDRIFANLDRYPGLDLSISYDIGAELNGIAAAYLADKRRLQKNPSLEPLVYLPETRAWFDGILAGYQKNFLVAKAGDYPYVFSRGHAFVILALDRMFEATGDARYLRTLKRYAEILDQFRGDRNAYACSSVGVFLDCHAAAVVALARAATATGLRRFAEAARRGMQAYQIDAGAAAGEDVFVATGNGGRDGQFWVFKAGLLLRSLDAVEELARRGLVTLDAGETRRLAELRRRAMAYVAATTHERPAGLEFYTSHRAGETNSETQAWVALGVAGMGEP